MREIASRADAGRHSFVHTLAAVPLIIAIYVVAGSLMGLVWYLSVGTDVWLPEPFPSIMTGVIAALAGVWAAKAACVAWLPNFSRKVAFLLFLIFLSAPLLSYVIGLGRETVGVGLVAGNITGIIAAWFLIWRDID